MWPSWSGRSATMPAAWLRDPARQWVFDDLISDHPIGGYHHMGTTRMADRRDALLGCAEVIIAARAAAEHKGCHATVGKLTVHPGAVNANPNAVTGSLPDSPFDLSDTGADTAKKPTGKSPGKKGNTNSNKDQTVAGKDANTNANTKAGNTNNRN